MSGHTPWVARKGAAAVATLAALGLMACGSNGGGSDADTPEEFFSGTTIRWIIPFSAGGGTDTAARQLAAILPEFIPGNPRIQVENIEGGNSIRGVNEFAAADPDGLTILQTSASTNSAYLFGDSAVRFDFADFEPIVGIPAGAVQYVSPSTGVVVPVDLYSAEEGLVYGGITPEGGELNRLLGFTVLELDVHEVFGYDSRSSIQIAFSQGEINIDGQTTQTYNENIVPLVERGEAIPVYTTGLTEDGELVRDPAFPDIPHIGEVYEEYFGQAPDGEDWEAYKYLVTVMNNLQKPVWIHQDAPEVAVEGLRQAFLDMQESDQWAELRASIGYDFVVGEQLKNDITALTDPPEDIIEWLRVYAAEEYNADLR